MLKRSATLAFTPFEQAFEAFDYRTGTQFECSLPVVDLLSGLGGWTDRDRVRDRARELLADEGDRAVEALAELQALIPANSTVAGEEVEFLTRWTFGPSTAIFHQSVSDRSIMPIDEQVEFQIEKARTDPSPDLFFQPPNDGLVVRLPDPETHQGLYTYLARRRTCREGVPFALGLEQLADMLFAGLGVTDWTVNRAGQKLPLRYVPSGGARNPYDAYVFVPNGAEFDAGVYRYSPVDHSLAFLSGTGSVPKLSDLLGGQDWADTASAVVVLVANFSRSMWKYEGDDNAYRVILIEAGHIGQNIMLMASQAGLAACPSAALNHELITATAGLTRHEQAPIYAMALTKPG